MKFYGLELKGDFWVQRQPDMTDLPWTEDDKGRLVYNEADDLLYYGGETEWIQSTQSRYTFNENQQIIFGLAASGGTVLPDDWNIPDDIDDRVPMITNSLSEVGNMGGDWMMDAVVTTGSHDHFTPEQMGNPTITVYMGYYHLFGLYESHSEHKHNISYDGSHNHTFDGSWRFPHTFWTIGQYQP